MKTRLPRNESNPASRHGDSIRCILKIHLLAIVATGLPLALGAADYQVLGWNNLGMHCMDSDYSVFSVLPPYNTIQAQLIANGALVTASNGYSITYEAVTDTEGSINTTSAGKGNWLQFAPLLYGAVAADQGLAFPGPDSFWMPGTNNTPQGMLFDPALNWFYAYGIPLTPYDDAGRKNPYPMMRVIARDSLGHAVATNDIVLPVSDEMDCRACHASGASAAAEPGAGWVWSGSRERDFRLNILRLHDEQNFARHQGLYVSALAARGFNPQGLYRSVVADGKPVLCAACHASEALGAGSYSNIPPLTASVHARHAGVQDPVLPIALDDSRNRAACYRCHPGSTTKCLRGAMGGAIAGDGTLEMQCQSCHGNMSQVGSTNRTGWLMEPNCQSCHTGTATTNSGQIRYTSCFTDTNWTVRLAVNQTFATQSNSPAAGLSLYRFSSGHGGLQCSACHGSTHAEFPTTHANDNRRNETIQGHAGVMVECTACHVSMSVSSTTAKGGPHGLHPIDGNWVDEHHDFIGSLADCEACHGIDHRGTPLSRAQASRTLAVDFDGTAVSFPVYRGAEIGCFNCHNGPDRSSPNTNAAPVVADITTNGFNSAPLSFALPVTGPGAVARILGQPAHGSVGVSNNVATYFPDPAFIGTNTFIFAAYDGSKNSLVATGTVVIAREQHGPFTATAFVPPTYPALWPAPFAVVAAAISETNAPTFDWDFGDGSTHSTNQYPAHLYTTPGTYNWSVTASVASGSLVLEAGRSGTIVVEPAVSLTAARAGATVVLSWPQITGDAVLEETVALAPTAAWTSCTNPVVPGSPFTVAVPNNGTKFYRLRRVW